MIKDNRGEIILLMGVLLSTIILSTSIYSSYLARVGSYVNEQSSKTLLPEFLNVKETLIYGINENADPLSEESIENAFETVKQDIFQREIKYGILFNATLDTIYPLDPIPIVRYAVITISLTDGDTYITDRICVQIGGR
ncbi:MAG TPA: hypothetical protein ENG74_00915 [Thermoplasmatales archaeon]|nr:hypothetical protein [Thermoplasmatales archaeon]